MKNMLDQAICIAAFAHAGQVDKQGKPEIIKAIR